jgi:NADH-ubiquinone oxidoreductase chain 1
MTEHSASIFVFFFLAEYASIVLICVLNSILFLGGYLSIIPIDLTIDLLNSLGGVDNNVIETIFTNISSSPLNLGFKTIFLVFVFI